MFTKDYGGVGQAIIMKFQKGHVCKKIKNERFGSSPGANHERIPGSGSFDMKDTLNLLS